MSPEEFAQIVAIEVAKKIGEMHISIPPGGARGIAVDEITGSGILVVISPGAAQSAPTAPSTIPFHRGKPKLKIVR